jgi:arabinose-5-phosphate isomerase
MTAITSPSGKLEGIFTDGDLRRLFEGGEDIRSLKVAQVMTKTPVVITADALAVEAVRIMEDGRRNQLLVVDDEGMLVGALHLHDLLIAKVV